MKILITGGGYLGSILTRKLLEKNYEVRVLDPMWYGKKSLQECFDNPKFELVQEDMRNLISTVKSMKGVDGVIHLASLVGMPVYKLSHLLVKKLIILPQKILLNFVNYMKFKHIFLQVHVLFMVHNLTNLLLKNHQLPH